MFPRDKSQPLRQCFSKINLFVAFCDGKVPPSVPLCQLVYLLLFSAKTDICVKLEAKSSNWILSAEFSFAGNKNDSCSCVCLIKIPERHFDTVKEVGETITQE